MQIRKLYRTIETIASRSFTNEEELLKNVLQAVIRNEEISMKGGRLWRFDSKTGTYALIFQDGEIERIRANFRVKVKDYPIFSELAQVRTVLAKEHDKYLRERGILKYSATGIGEKIQWRGKTLYRYMMAFNADNIDENLTSTLNIISAALNSALSGKKIERQARKLEAEMDKAREIQRSILPQHEMRFNKYELYGVSLADLVVGGDFFDYLQFEQDTERLGVVIGDAASKGFSAAAQALYVSGALRMGFAFQTKIGSLLSRINALVHQTFSEEQFVSLFYCELTDAKNGLVLFANCGHNHPIVYRHQTGSHEFLETTGQMLGPFPEATFKTENILMNKGDILLLYTDGVSEARNEQGEFYGERRIVEQMEKHHKNSAKDITRLLLEDVQTYSASSEHADDKTIVTIKRVE
ncbi:MAG: serine/threonine-protein phosphatase [Ignavibacteriae bacterium]|nr:serine/threonine-protein phosphatase [Ignavibacteriota bacterium]